MKTAKPVAEVTQTVFCDLWRGGVSAGPFGQLYFCDTATLEGGTSGLWPPDALGLLGKGAELEITFRVKSRGKLIKNPWHDGKGRPKPPRFPKECDLRGKIKGPVAGHNQ